MEMKMGVCVLTFVEKKIRWGAVDEVGGVISGTAICLLLYEVCVVYDITCLHACRQGFVVVSSVVSKVVCIGCCCSKSSSSSMGVVLGQEWLLLVMVVVLTAVVLTASCGCDETEKSCGVWVHRRSPLSTNQTGRHQNNQSTPLSPLARCYI